MSITTVNYFHSATLRRRYLDELDAALQGKRIRAQERLWLQEITRPRGTGNADLLRIDRLGFDRSRARPFELSAALMLSHAHTDGLRVYLYTLAAGIEAFSDRRVLLAALRERFADGDPHMLFEYEKIDGDPFHAQMLAIIDHQVEQVTQLTAQLKLTPSLQQAASASISRQLQASLAHLSLDPDTHLLQLVSNSRGDADWIPTSQTLTRATFDDFCTVQLAKGCERRFLDARGRVATATDIALFTEALADAAAGVAERYAALLKAFWGETWNAQRTRRDLAIESLHGSWRSAVYRGRHDETLSAGVFDLLRPVLQSITGTLPTNTALRCSRLIISIGEAAYPLAGTFVLHSAASDDRSLLWFSPDHSLVRFTDQAALAMHLASVEGRAQLRPTLALQDQAVLLADAVPQVALEVIQGPFFADRVDSILALQARNLAYVMTLSTRPDEMTAMIDDALDIRQLLDPRQLQLGAGRWRRNAPFNFADVWLGPRSSAADDAQASAPTHESEPVSQSASNADTGIDGDTRLTPSWREQIQTLDRRAAGLRRMDNGLREYAEQALQSYLCVLLVGAVQVESIQVQWLHSGPVDSSDVETLAVPVAESQRSVSMGLVSLLLECVSGHRSLPLPAAMQVVPDSMSGGEHLQGVLINHMLDRLARDFTDRYVDRFKQSCAELQRQDDRQWQVDREALALRERAMRIDLAVGKRQKWYDQAAIGMVRQVLERPLRSLRMAPGELVTEAFSLSVTHGGNFAGVLSDTLVVRQPLNPGSSVMLWTCELGWQEFSSVQKLQAMLQRELGTPHSERWLALLCERDRTLLRGHLQSAAGNQVQVRLDRIDGHATQTLQQQVLDRKRQDLRQLCRRAIRCRFEAGLFTRLATATEHDGQVIDMLDRLSLRVDNCLIEALLPPWLTSAPLADLRQYHHLLKRYYFASDGGKVFLFGIKSLQDYACQRLITQLRLDFPRQAFEPNGITVTSRRYVAAFPAAGQLPSAVPAATVVHRESLTEYAINRFVDTQGAALAVDSAQHLQAASLLTPVYLRQLVRGLDVAAGYTASLRKALAVDDPDYPTRKRLFIEQLPPMLLVVALGEKLKGTLSAVAYEFISHILDMPDALAREPVNGVRVMISSLQLVADAGRAPDQIAGIYLICPAAGGAGPVVLCAIRHSPFIFREYPSSSALLDDIRADETLQQLLLDRMDPEVYRRYAHGGFVEPHLASSVGLFDFDVPLRRPGPVTLQLTEEKGNALELLFSGVIKVLLDVGVANAVTNEQDDRAGRDFLAALGVEQVLSLLPGKLAALVTLWQSQTLFRASAMSASGHRWGEALSEFSAALGVMVTARGQAIEEQAAPDDVEAEPVSVETLQGASKFSWRTTVLTDDQRIRLKALEARDVALSDMKHDRLLNLYLSKRNGTPYAVVAGSVYQVRHLIDEGKWLIVGNDGTLGPRLTLDTRQHWQIDLSMRLRGGGGLVTKLNAAGAQRSAEDVLVIEASGMPQIRTRYRDRAMRIGQAHLQAKGYLENCLDNLHLHQRNAPLDPRVKRIIGDFFGTDEPDTELLAETEKAIKALFDEVMDASLSPFSSPRFVVGSNRPGRESVTAFMIDADPKRRLYLTERFFDVPHYALTSEAAAQGFESSIHHRAAILIHELSHLVLDTYDIAYLDAMAPYPDLLLEGTADDVRFKADITRLHESGLSHRSDRSRLFKLNTEGQWRDITAADNAGLSDILRITDTKTLDEARDIFLRDARKRAGILLKNADSLTLLILLLGRHNYVEPAL